MNGIQYAERLDILEIERIMALGQATTENVDWYVADDRAFIERHICEEGYILKYMQEEQIAGFLLVRHPKLAEDNLGRYLPEWTDEMLHQVAHMESAAVLPEYRGQKIQKKLLQRAEELERVKGMAYLMATVHPENVYSSGNLEALGYECLLETEKYGGLRRRILCKKLFEWK